MQKTSDWLMSFKSEKASTHFNHSVSDLRLKSKNGSTKISITGGKGGVGKTSVSLRMGKELASLGHKVLLIDADSNLSNTAIKLGLPIDNSFWQLLAGEKTFNDCVIKQENFHLLPACNGSAELFESKLQLDEVIIDIISGHEDEYDYILLDCPAGLSRESLTLNAYCDHRIVVVTPDKSSITDSYSLIKVLSSRFGIKENHLLVNMYQNEKQYQKVVLTLSETIENFLGARTYVVGGIRKLDINSESFDNFFLFGQESEWHKNFLKMVQMFTERWGTPRATHIVRDRSGMEQEVH